MKRSEMIEILADEIDNIIEAYITRESLIERANYLLTKLEDVGMLPPLQKNLDMYTEPYQWEPEDETTQTSNP